MYSLFLYVYEYIYIYIGMLYVNTYISVNMYV